MGASWVAWSSQFCSHAEEMNVLHAFFFKHRDVIMANYLLVF